MRRRFVELGEDDVQAAALGDAAASRMSVPRPAMLVATVIAPGVARARRRSRPRRASWRAFSTSGARPLAASSAPSCSEAATERVPTSTGRPAALQPARRIARPPPTSRAASRTRPTPCVAASHRPVGRDAHHLQPVDRPQLARDLARGAGHAGQVQVAPEEALVGDARQRLALAGELAAFLDLDQLVQPALPGAVGHQAAGVLVDDLHLAVAHEVVLVALEEVQRGQRLATSSSRRSARPSRCPSQIRQRRAAAPARRRRSAGCARSRARAR